MQRLVLTLPLHQLPSLPLRLVPLRLLQRRQLRTQRLQPPRHVVVLRRRLTPTRGFESHPERNFFGRCRRVRVPSGRIFFVTSVVYLSWWGNLIHCMRIGIQRQIHVVSVCPHPCNRVFKPVGEAAVPPLQAVSHSVPSTARTDSVRRGPPPPAPPAASPLEHTTKCQLIFTQPVLL